jgi:hypothetical protein
MWAGNKWKVWTAADFSTAFPASSNGQVALFFTAHYTGWQMKYLDTVVGYFYNSA